MESPTSSVSPPTESDSAETVGAKPEFKEEAGLRVSVEAKQRFLMSLDPSFQNNKVALKCPGCNLLTAHVTLIVTMYAHSDHITDEKAKFSKRIVGCQHCGKISTK